MKTVSLDVHSDSSQLAVASESGEIFMEMKVEESMVEGQGYDLIVMGSHGHSDISGLFLGSVTHKVLNTIYCPVLVVPESG